MAVAPPSAPIAFWAAPAGSWILVAVLVGCDSGPSPTAADAGSADAAATDAAAVGVGSAPGAAMAVPPDGGAPTSPMQCTPGTQRVDVCPQPDPRCMTAGGYSIATCEQGGTLGPCQCMADPIPYEPASAQETAACLDASKAGLSDGCAECVCTESKHCATALAGCQGECQALLQCLATCVPGGNADIDCVTKCVNAFPASAVASFGMSFPECAAHCPDTCIDGLRPGQPVVPDDDAGT